MKKTILILLLAAVLLFTGCESSATLPAAEPVPVQETEASATPAPSQVTADIPEGSSFEIHFIDVGQADSALVLCDGDALLIDGGNAADSDLIYSYLKEHGITHLSGIVATHAHEDHMGGLNGALSYATADMA